ncbi:MAG: acyl-CoA reductase [Bergeyella sp.]|nr:acyl-CoA reductase [Bergeyella sp.]
MRREKYISALIKVGEFIHRFFAKNKSEYGDREEKFSEILRKTERENPWFTQENLEYALVHWGQILNKKNIEKWQNPYRFSLRPKKIGLVLAGNIPMVGFHDVLSVILSGHVPFIKYSSKDRVLIPFLLDLWNEFSENELVYEEEVEKLENFDAVIATGSNHTARYLEYYFRDYPKIIRKNRTSVAVLDGEESHEDLQCLSQDIFRYFGLGCRNVTHVMMPEKFETERLFESFENFSGVSKHHKYYNNYEYNRAVFLLNQEKFWDNNFVIIKEDEQLFSPLAVVYISRYSDFSQVGEYTEKNKENIQCVVSGNPKRIKDSIFFGTSQKPDLSAYADNTDTMKFLEML